MSLLAGVSSQYPYAPVQLHDSWIAVDPVIGCKANCAYCLLQLAGWTGHRPEVTMPVDAAVELLLDNRFFEPGRSRICFGTRTDPLLPEVRHYAQEFIGALEERGLTNPVVLVSKLRLTEPLAEFLVGLRHVRPVLFVTWSGLPSRLEPGIPSDGGRASIALAARLGLPVLHYFRPVIDANTSDEVLRAVFDQVAGHAKATVHVGLKVNQNLNRFYARHPDLAGAARQPPDAGAWTPPGAVDRLRRYLVARHPGHPLFEHTSCAVSMVLGEADYTGTYFRDDVCQASECPAAQRSICGASARVPTVDEVATRLRSLGLDNPVAVVDGDVRIGGSLGQEEYCYVLHAVSYPITVTVNFFRVFRGGIFSGVPGRGPQ